MPKDKNKLAIALGIKNLPEKDREEILARVDRRLQEVLIATLIKSISEEDALKIQIALNEGGDLEEVVAQIAAGVPGLAIKIENAIEEEIIRLYAVLKQ